MVTPESSGLLEARLEYFQLSSCLLRASWKRPASPLFRVSEYLSGVDMIQEWSTCLLEDAFL